MTIEVPRLHANVIDAAAAGAFEGLHLALNVGAMFIDLAKNFTVG